MVTSAENKDFLKIKEDLSALGIKKGDDVLVHSAYKKLGGAEGGIDTVIDALISTVGDSGTILFPTLSYEYVNPNPPVNNNVFDVLNTPCCVGAMPNVFMKRDGVERSLHPTHSVAAIGARQNEYIKDHLSDSQPVGKNSPFFKLSQMGGKIMFLGCSISSNTSMHGVEEYAPVPYALSEDTREYVIIDKSGNRTSKPYHYHCIHKNGYEQRYSRVAQILEFTSGKVLQGECHVMESEKLWKNALEKLKEDPYFFVEKFN